MCSHRELPLCERLPGIHLSPVIQTMLFAEGERNIGLGPRSEIAVGFPRITVDPKQMDGVSCIRGLRIPVTTVVEMIADGMAEAEILAAYPDLEPEDLHEAQRYAAAVRERAPLSGSSSRD